VKALLRYLNAVTGKDFMPGITAVIQTFSERINLHPHLHLPITEKPPPPLLLEQVALMAAEPGVEYF
jgi:hypothetical protein